MYAWSRIASAAPVCEENREPYSREGAQSVALSAGDAEVLAPLRGLGSIVHFQRGAVIFRERDHASAIYRVLSGGVALSRTTDGRRRILDFRFAGEFFGAVHRPEYNLAADATSDCVLLAYPRGYIDAMFEELPQFCRAITVLLAAPAQSGGSAAECQTARERIVDFLASLSGRIAGWDDDNLPLSCNDIADRLDLSPVAVDRALRALESHAPLHA